MKVYLQTLTHDGEPRGRQLVLETAAPAEAVKAALEGITATLGTVTAVPPAPHEANLRQVLPRDLAAAGVAAGTSGGGEALLRIQRTPAEKADVTQLSYMVEIKSS